MIPLPLLSEKVQVNAGKFHLFRFLYETEVVILITSIIILRLSELSNFFSLRISSVSVTNLVTFTEEILNGKLHFLCSVYCFFDCNFLCTRDILF